jgi:hypothetical protein
MDAAELDAIVGVPVRRSARSTRPQFPRTLVPAGARVKFHSHLLMDRGARAAAASHRLGPARREVSWPHFPGHILTGLPRERIAPGSVRAVAQQSDRQGTFYPPDGHARRVRKVGACGGTAKFPYLVPSTR